jgi:hypothetical protein
MKEERRRERSRGIEADWKGNETSDSELKKTRIEIPGLY